MNQELIEKCSFKKGTVSNQQICIDNECSDDKQRIEMEIDFAKLFYAKQHFPLASLI